MKKIKNEAVYRSDPTEARSGRRFKVSKPQMNLPC